MKKTVVLVALCLLVASTAFATENDVTSYYEADMLLKNAKELSESQINMLAELTPDLTATQRAMLQEANRKSATLPLVVNLLLGCGIGSYIQGDMTGGTIGLVADVASSILVTAGYVQMVNASLGSPSADLQGSGLLTIGILGAVASKIYQIVRPISFSSEYNAKMSQALMSVAVVPALGPSHDFQMHLIAKVSLD